MRLRHLWFSSLGLMLAASVAACGGGDSGSSSSSAEPSAPAATPSGQKVDTDTAGKFRFTIIV
jgi:hypothetical protein